MWFMPSGWPTPTSRIPINLARNIDIPVHLQIDQGRGWTVDGHIELFGALQGRTKLVIGSYPPM